EKTLISKLSQLISLNISLFLLQARVTYIRLDCGFIYTLPKPFDEKPDTYVYPQCIAPKKRFARSDVNTSEEEGCLRSGLRHKYAYTTTQAPRASLSVHLPPPFSSTKSQSKDLNLLTKKKIETLCRVRSNRKPSPMALEWVVLGYAAAAEAIMVILLTMPGLDALRKGLIAVTRNLLKPFLSIIPFCLFLLMDIYWKYETRPSCDGDSCTPSEHLRHQKSIMKSQRNALLIASALVFYWILYSVTNLVVRIEQLNQRVERLRKRE
ncbi:unnamed protein product, partial [Brassica oleracea var. botrytis]